MRFLGMELYPRRKSDDEYVEAVRKSIERSRRLALIA